MVQNGYRATHLYARLVVGCCVHWEGLECYSATFRRDDTLSRKEAMGNAIFAHAAAYSDRRMPGECRLAIRYRQGY